MVNLVLLLTVHNLATRSIRFLLTLLGVAPLKLEAEISGSARKQVR